MRITSARTLHFLHRSLSTPTSPIAVWLQQPERRPASQRRRSQESLISLFPAPSSTVMDDVLFSSLLLYRATAAAAALLSSRPSSTPLLATYPAPPAAHRTCAVAAWYPASDSHRSATDHAALSQRLVPRRRVAARADVGRTWCRTTWQRQARTQCRRESERPQSAVSGRDHCSGSFPTQQPRRQQAGGGC